MDGAAPHMPSVAEPRARIDVELRAGWRLETAVRRSGIVGLLAIKPAEAVLDQIFVRPDAQGTGIGAALLERAKRAMPGGFTLRKAAANGRAGRFYEKHGLKLLRAGVHPQSDRPVRFYGWDAR